VISQVLGAMHRTSAARWELWRPRNGSVTTVRWQDDRGTLVSFDRLPSPAPLKIGAPQHT
jgi:hypothetical protein